jgi:hypothetical protein
MSGRSDQSFPTRIYPYRKSAAGPAPFSGGAPPAFPKGVFRFRLGRDATPAPMSAQEVSAELGDPFAQLLLSKGVFPLSLRALLAALDAHNASQNGIPFQRSFLVADGGKVVWTPQTATLRREFRFVISRSKSAGAQPDLLVSASTSIDSETIFLQLIGWDPVHEVFHFYQRLGQGWAWAGTSWDALSDDTCGRGPFDSHVNGSLVMKELKAPWSHWHSMAASVTAESLAPDDSLRSESLFLQKSGAERLETEVVRPGIRRWNDARFKRLFQNGVLRNAPAFLRQVLFTTTVNLVSAPEERSQVRVGEPIHLPLSFFLNDEALLNLLELPANIQRPQVDGAIYTRCLTQYNVSISDGNFVLPGDAHFVFIVPEPAFEDQVVLQKLVRLGLMPPKLAATLLMVDFPNPLFSLRRVALLAHMPQEVRAGDPSDLAAKIVDSINQSGAAHGSVEAEFLQNWTLPDDQWQQAFARRIEDYMHRVEEATRTFEGFEPLFRLAESRRREFRKRPLAEFRLTTPLTNIPEDASFLEMTPLATVQQK